MPSINQELIERELIARELLSRGIDEVDLQLHPDVGALPPIFSATADLALQFPLGLEPTPTAPDPAANPSSALEAADVLVVTWTVDEQDALADVLTPGFGRKTWTRYDRNFAATYDDQIRPGAPSKRARRLGSWCRTAVGGQQVVCYKSELHLNQDGIRDANGPGFASLPVQDMFAQLIDEIQPSVVITTGTAGGVFDDDDLGDVAVTRGAKFRCASEFKNAPFNDQTFTKNWAIPTSRFHDAILMMRSLQGRLVEPPIHAPTARHTGPPFHSPTYVPSIRLDRGIGNDTGNEVIGMPEFHPILTTDFFEYGTSTNELFQEGCMVEMGDAVLGMVVDGMNNGAPDWVVVRNASDPQINGVLDRALQMDFAVWYYKKFGYWTSVMSALTTWAIIAGL